MEHGAMKPLRALGLITLFVLGGAAALAAISFALAQRDAEQAWRTIASRVEGPDEVYNPSQVADLPEIAQRYLNHAIAPGTPLRTSVELEMEGTFLLGDKESYQTYAMVARQILRPPFEFVWMPRLRSGPMRIAGSDALVGDEAWTRFWLMSLIPVAKARTTPDLLRSAQFRAAMEGVWVPASLLPQNGVAWKQVGPDTARVTVQRTVPPIVLEFTLAPDGALREVEGQRWSNANPDQTFRVQPFGGTIEGEASFEGYTIPAVLKVGNHYGTPDYLPFFQATITRASYLDGTQTASQ
jgi:hypothetical protein